tara:strand:+ start:672 stop:1628 length:957 start_codon:yes stop_codon:yes gene_type:complete
VKVEWGDRKSKALTPSSLRCLSYLPTVNLTTGCVHDCIYCYIRGYSQYPGQSAVRVYRNTAQLIARELDRKRNKPLAVYFSPSSDAFMPVKEVLDEAYQVMKLLLDRRIGIQFVTKGKVPEMFLELFAKQPELVAGQVGLCTLDDALNDVIEPNAALASDRLDTLWQLVRIGVTTSLRADPLIHGVTDHDDDLDRLFARVSACGIRHVSASYLFLRPAIVGSFKRNIADPDLLNRIFEPFEQARRSAICGSSSSALSLPAKVRETQLERVQHIAKQHGLTLNICGCKNEDLTSSKCHLTNLTVTAKAAKRPVDQATLW